MSLCMCNMEVYRGHLNVNDADDERQSNTHDGESAYMFELMPTSVPLRWCTMNAVPASSVIADRLGTETGSQCF